MATPAIQTLITDAQQVLNLKSLSEIRATLTAVLANANVGTPLNPNLTTQQLWDEFYEIVRQSPTDIESILVNQMMKFVFSPPAPGGAGANHEVIYNNNGVLAGDPKFLWDDALNKLDIDGSATISGDLTVNTNVLKVDSTNDRVGVKTATPAAALHVASGNIRLDDGFQLEFGGSTNSVAGSNATNTVQIYTNNVERYNINSTGVSTWSVGGSTAMTLNSTGLGVGTTDTTNGRLNIRAGTAATGNSLFLQNLDGTYNPYLQIQHSSSGIKLYTSSSFGGDAGNLTIGCGGATNALIVNGSGNVGVGVTPSAWGSSSKALQIGGSSASVSSTGAGSTASRFAHGAYFDNTNWIYQNTSVGAALYQVTGANAGSTHAWYTSAGGTAGNTITDFATAKMTLDASGNLLVGTTSGSFRGTFVVAGGADRDILVAGVTGVSGGFQVKWNNSTSKINVIIENIPTSSAGLATGTLWNDAGTIKIA